MSTEFKKGSQTTVCIKCQGSLTNLTENKKWESVLDERCYFLVKSQRSTVQI